MLYPELHIDLTSENPLYYVRILDTDPFTMAGECTHIPLTNVPNPIEFLVNLSRDFLYQYEDGFEDGFCEGELNSEED